MGIRDSLSNGNSRCKGPEMGGSLEHWRNRGKAKVTGSCEGGRMMVDKPGRLAGATFKLGLVNYGKTFECYLKRNRKH